MWWSGTKKNFRHTTTTAERKSGNKKKRQDGPWVKRNIWPLGSLVATGKKGAGPLALGKKVDV